MNNNIVQSICAALGDKSIASLRFNFRGAGNSGGRHADGIGEQDDVKAALSFLMERDEIDSDRLGLCGYSFGTMVGIPVADVDSRVRAYAGVSPFFVSPGLLKNNTRPKFFICGSEDEYVNPGGLEVFISNLPEPKIFEIISGADHFWWGFDRQVGIKQFQFGICILMKLNISIPHCFCILHDQVGFYADVDIIGIKEFDSIYTMIKVSGFYIRMI